MQCGIQWDILDWDQMGQIPIDLKVIQYKSFLLLHFLAIVVNNICCLQKLNVPYSFISIEINTISTN